MQISSKSLFYLGLIFLLIPTYSVSQDSPSFPSSLLNPNPSSSLADLLRTELLKRLQEPQKSSNESFPRRKSRPRPELGHRSDISEPVDLSKYIGPAGDPQKTWEKLQETGKIPAPPASPEPASATSPWRELMKDQPVEKRLAFVEDLLKRRKYPSAKEEIEQILDSGVKGKDLLNTLLLREKALFHLRYYDTVEDDYFRLKMCYPQEKKIEDLKSYLDQTSGITELQNAVLNKPAEPTVQRTLLDRYFQLGWLDFAEEFFSETIHPVTEASIHSLSEIYYKKKDYPMLVSLSRAAQKLYPQKADYVYNEGVGLYAQGDPISLEQAKTVFPKARSLAQTPAMRNNVDWYLQRLTTKSR